jgi:ribosomal protein L37E
VAVFDERKMCALCGKHKDQHERDPEWEEWDCPREGPHELRENFACCDEPLNVSVRGGEKTFSCGRCGSKWVRLGA